MKKTTKKLNTLRFLAFLLICSTLVSLTVLSVSAVESGGCGDGVAWVLDAGTLTITGAGEMKNYHDSELAPWYEFREQIIRVEISDKITSIGNMAFYGCKNLVAANIPNSVKTIGSYAFASCNRLAFVQMGGSVSSIGEGAFYSCYALESIRLPYGLSYLGSQAFYRCESLHSISVPSDVRTMGDSVFAYCKGLVRAEIYARIGELPAWTFYGCSQLSEVYLPETVSDIDNNGFKKCDSLSTVFYSGTEKHAEKIEEQISGDVASFQASGYITNEKISDSSLSGTTVYKENNVTVQTDTMVVQNDQLIMSSTVERTYKSDSDKKGTHTADVMLTVEHDNYWEYAATEVIKALTNIEKTYSDISTAKKTVVTLHLQNGVTMSRAFLNRLAGRDVQLVVYLSNGSSWSIACTDLKVENAEESVSPTYSHTLKEAPAEVVEELGTDDCYRIVFDSTAEQKAEVVVQLPTQTAMHTNAYLYKIEEDGSYTKLQGVAVDNTGCARFYIATVDKYSDYVIGLDVQGEDITEVIIPEELMPPSSSSTSSSSALERLEEVTYVKVERNYKMGVGYGGITWILIGVLAATTIIVGGVMTILNKMKKMKMSNSKEQTAN